MKRLHLFIVMCLLSLTSGLQAQEQADPGEQLLVFRNTGVVDLLYTNEVDSILTNDSTQVFYAKDTVLVVPIAELDSVAVGSRNEMKFHDGVKELKKTEDLPWIIRFDGQSIYYRLDTPTSILPVVGMKLFYGIEEQLTENTVFPFGLSVKVTNVTKLSEEIRVDVELIRLNEIFERLFLAGSFSGSAPMMTNSRQVIRRAPVHSTLDLGYEIDVENVGSIGVNGNLEIKGDAVISMNPFHNRSHADLILSYGFGTDVKLEAQENARYHFEELGRDIRIGTFYGLLNLDAAIGAFADLSAELNLDIGIQRTYHRRLLWDRNGDESTFEFREVKTNEPYTDEAKIDLTLKGELFFGPVVKIDFATIGDLVGARAKVKVGPKIEGTISLGMLQDMRNYQSEFYGNATLNLCSQVAVEGFVINRHNLVWGKVDEHKIFNVAFNFGEHEWKLFPDYTQSNATATTMPTTKEVKTDIATAIEEPTPTVIETGFEIVDPQGEVVDSIFVGTIEAEPEDTTVAQTFDAEIILPSTIKQENLEGYTMRPIFRYAGYTISAAPVGIRKDAQLQSYSATQTNGAMTFIGNSPFLGSVVKDSTLYQVGLYLPVPLKNNVYQQGKDRRIIIGTPIDDYRSSLLIGTWMGKVNGEDVTLVFNEDETGEFNKVAFDYELNNPQSGDLVLKFDNGEPMILRLLSVSEVELKLRDKRDKEQTVWTLTR